MILILDNASKICNVELFLSSQDTFYPLGVKFLTQIDVEDVEKLQTQILYYL